MGTVTALFIGLGSIGTRHLKNLHAICEKQGLTLCAHALRSDLNRPLRPGVAELLAAAIWPTCFPRGRKPMWPPPCGGAGPCWR